MIELSIINYLPSVAIYRDYIYVIQIVTTTTTCKGSNTEEKTRNKTGFDTAPFAY